MSGIYIAPAEREGLRAIDIRELETRVDEAIASARPGLLQDVPLWRCGPAVTGPLGAFERAIADYARAKAVRKREVTRTQAVRAGYALVDAVRDGQERMGQEEREEQLFRIDDSVREPYSFNESLSVFVSYRWREAIEDEWTFASITVTHEVQQRPAFAVWHQGPAPRRPPTATKREAKRQDDLRSTWQYLKALALSSLRDYLLSGKDRTAIPSTFAARPSQYGGGLDNFSAQFWTGSA